MSRSAQSWSKSPKAEACSPELEAESRRPTRTLREDSGRASSQVRDAAGQSFRFTNCQLRSLQLAPRALSLTCASILCSAESPSARAQGSGFRD